MGDVGSLPLGATLDLVAVMTGQWLLLPVVGFVFVMEAGSVIFQVTYFKWTKRLYGEGRRIFKCRPCTITLNCSAGAKPRSKNVSG